MATPAARSVGYAVCSTRKQNLLDEPSAMSLKRLSLYGEMEELYDPGRHRQNGKPGALERVLQVNGKLERAL